MNKIKVMIVDDQLLMRDGLSTILSIQEDIEVVAQAENGQEALELLKKCQVDVILMDVRMPIMDGVTCTRKVMALGKNIKIIILTTFDDDDYILNALSYGASGYILKNIDGQSLVKSVREVMTGHLLLPGNIANKLAANIKTIKNEKDSKKIESDNLIETFTKREIDIIRIFVKGLSNKEIAGELFLSEGTVKNYITSIYSKINTKDRVNAMLILQKLDFK